MTAVRAETFSEPNAIRLGPVASLASKPHMPRHVRLQFDELRKRHVVLAPERIYWPDDVTVDLLRLCDGKRSISEIAATLAKEYAAPRETIETDVLEFVQSWANIRLLRL